MDIDDRTQQYTQNDLLQRSLQQTSSNMNDSFCCKFILFPNCNEECRISKLYAVRQSIWLFLLEWVVYILSGGIALFILWKLPQWRFKLFFQKTIPFQSQGVALFGTDGDFCLIPYLKLVHQKGKVFQYRFLRYKLNDQETFVPLQDNPYEMRCNELVNYLDNKKVTKQFIAQTMERNGQNVTDVPDKGLLNLILLELLSPFYFFQAGSCLLWFYEGYIYYAYVIIAAILGGFVTKIFSERTSFLRLKRISFFRTKVTAIRSGKRILLCNSELIFGDTVIIGQDEIASCDLLVTQGSAIVNESRLVGSCLPKVKKALTINTDLFTENNENIIFCGSILTQAQNLQCQVLRIGFETKRGNMIRSIIFRKKNIHLSLTSDPYYFILILGFAALISFLISLPTFMRKLDQNLIEMKDVIIRCLDLATISVPPILPACLSFIITFSAQRLRKNSVFCINSSSINICGIVRTICFDKTGTLTESIVRFKNVSQFDPLEQTFIDCVEIQELQTLPKLQRVILGGCHSLRRCNGKYVGDPLDEEMFNRSGWVMSSKLEDHLRSEGCGVIQEIVSKSSKEIIEVIRCMDFDPRTGIMSSLVRFEKQTYILTKGSPEKMKELCTKDSLPQDMNYYETKISTYTNKGMRVLAMGYKCINIYDIGHNRRKLEKDLVFQGFQVFENFLKPKAANLIKNLNSSNFQVNMITGDNPQTSLAIGLQSNILSNDFPVTILDIQDNNIVMTSRGESKNLNSIREITSDVRNQLVVTGNFFNKYFQSDCSDVDSLIQLRNLLFMTKVYARMESNQKLSLIRLLQQNASKNNYTFVGMCGDGANDCQAIQNSDVGISIGEQEASMSADIITKILDISIIEQILKEGRCCLQTYFQSFKFIALYSLIQVSTTVIEYQRGVIPSDYQFLYWDLFIVLPLAFLIGLTKASPNFSDKAQIHRLFCLNNILSVAGVGVIQLSFLILSVVLTSSTKWYIDPITFQQQSGLDASELLMNSFDNTVLFWTSNCSYLGTLFIFIIGSEHKKPIYTNFFFCTYFIIILSFSIFLIFTTNDDINQFFQIMPELKSIEDESVIQQMEYSWRFVILALVVANFLCTFCYEKFMLKVIMNYAQSKYPSIVYQGVSTFETDYKPNIDETHSLKMNTETE